MMPSVDPERRRQTQRESVARRRRAAGQQTATGNHPAPAYAAGRRIETSSGIKEVGEPVDVSSWTGRAIQVALNAGEIVHFGSGSAHFVALERLHLGDNRFAEVGDLITDSTWRSGRGPLAYLRAGKIRPADPAAVVPL